MGETISIVGGALIGSDGIPDIDQIDCAFVILPYDALIESNDTNVNAKNNWTLLFIISSIKLTVLITIKGYS